MSNVRSESPDLNPDLNSLALPSYAMVTFSAVTHLQLHPATGAVVRQQVELEK